jgi:hypothetical protein
MTGPRRRARAKKALTVVGGRASIAVVYVGGGQYLAVMYGILLHRMRDPESPLLAHRMANSGLGEGHFTPVRASHAAECERSRYERQ